MAENDRKIQLIKKFYTNSLKQALDENDISRSSFYHGFVESEKLDAMYKDVRDKILFMADVIIEIETIEYIKGLPKKQQHDVITDKYGFPLIKEVGLKKAQSQKKFKNSDGYLMLKRIETIEKILKELVENEWG